MLLAPQKGPEETPHPVSHLDHLLPTGEGKDSPGAPAPHGDAFPLRGERVDRAARFHQRARDG